MVSDKYEMCGTGWQARDSGRVLHPNSTGQEAGNSGKVFMFQFCGEFHLMKKRVLFLRPAYWLRLTYTGGG